MPMLPMQSVCQCLGCLCRLLHRHTHSVNCSGYATTMPTLQSCEGYARTVPTLQTMKAMQLSCQLWRLCSYAIIVPTLQSCEGYAIIVPTLSMHQQRAGQQFRGGGVWRVSVIVTVGTQAQNSAIYQLKFNKKGRNSYIDYPVLSSCINWGNNRVCGDFLSAINPHSVTIGNVAYNACGVNRKIIEKRLDFLAKMWYKCYPVISIYRDYCRRTLYGVGIMFLKRIKQWLFFYLHLR